MSTGWLHHHPGPHKSPLRRLPAALKLGLGLAIILGTVLAPLGMTGWFAGVGLFLALAILWSRLPVLFFVKRLVVLSPFVFGVALVNAWEPAGRGTWLGVALKGALCVLTVTLVSNTTSFSEILRVLRTARVPALLITTTALMHRYLFVLVDESSRMRRARVSRTFRRGPRVGWKSLATVAGQLFIRASERAERIYDAMCARGWK